jgi:ATP dependent DNA ligase domain
MAPEGDAWLHEIKYDGYRIGCFINRGAVTLTSRNAKDWTASFPEIRDAAKQLGVNQALPDDKVAIVLEDGRTSFQTLQNAFGGGSMCRAGLFRVRPPSPQRHRLGSSAARAPQGPTASTQTAALRRRLRTLALTTPAIFKRCLGGLIWLFLEGCGPVGMAGLYGIRNGALRRHIPQGHNIQLLSP